MNKEYKDSASEKDKLIATLKLSEKDHRILLEESTDPIFSFEPDGTYKYVNKAFADPFGIEPEEILGKKIWDIFDKDEAEKRFAVVKKVFESGEQAEVEVRVPQPDPKKDLYFLTTVKPIFDNDKNVSWVLCISKNISQRKYFEQERETYLKKLAEANEKLEKTIINRDNLFSIIAHDLRSPFQSLINISSLLKENFENLNKQEIEELLDSIENTSKNTFTLLEDLLTWANFQQDKIVLHIERNNICTLFKEIKNLYESSLENKNIELQIICSEKTFAYFDKNSISLVLRNFLSNAIKFTPEKGKIIIGVQEIENEIKVFVKDNGTGIADNLKNKIFKKESMVTTTGTQGEKGTGLGLVLCKKFIDKNKGRIWFESELNKGTTFYFTLPIFKE